jgi:hypothetical protein
MRNFLRRIGTVLAARERTSGEPRSPNGASSFHLVWTVPQVPLQSVAATLEVLEPPTSNRLYFWALQVSFSGERRLQGSGHIGLQWNRRHPGSTAANWGGYQQSTPQRSLLSGSESALPSARNDPNTRDYGWKPGHRYRMAIAKGTGAPDGLVAWRGTVTDLESGEEVVVRDLYSSGSHLTSPMVWSEVFARCESPAVTVRWSDLTAVAESGEEVRPRAVRINYQSRADGGCDNTTVAVDELGILQTTSTTRQVPQGAALPVPG